MVINNTIINKLKDSKNVAIFTHVNPDGDCLGSASALKQALVKMGKTADIYCGDQTISENYLFIKYIDLVNKPQNKNYDLAVAVDCSDLNRLGKTAEIFKSIKNSIKIDHHKTQENFAQVNEVVTVSSTCLILYDYLKELVELDGDIACALFAGISSDTGSFIHSNTTSLEHLIASELLKYEFDLENLNYNLFKKRSLNQILLLKLAYNSLRFYSNNRVAIVTLNMRDYQSTHTTRADAIGTTEIAVNIQDVEMGVTISEERKGLFSCSFRSKGNVDVSLVAQTFGGGGHERAAGCNIFGHAGTVTKKIVDAFEKEYKIKK